MDYSKHQFGLMFKENYQMMYRVAYLILEDAESAKDAVSQVFTELWHKQPTIKEGTERTYLLTATRNQSLHALKKRKRQMVLERNLSISEGDQQDTEHQELMNELQRVIDSNLTEQDRRILSLHYGEEMTYTKTAQAMGISPSAVNKHITRSLSKIRNILKTSKHYEN